MAAINDDDAIIGNYYDDVLGGGFVRTRKGDIIAIDPPGSFLTIPSAINNKVVIVGTFCADGVTCPAFLLLPR